MSTRTGAAALAVLLLLVSGCTDEEPEGTQRDAPETASPSSDRPTDPTTKPRKAVEPPSAASVVDTITTGLTSPWGMAFLPDGDALVSERDTGLIKRVPSNAGGVTVVGEIPEADASSEGGLLGLAVHPRFPAQPWVYAYYSTEVDNRVVRMRYADGRLGEQQLLLDGITVGAVHNGGRIAFGPDGALYVATGDGSERDRAQDRASLNGKILRLSANGEPVADNPFGPASPVFSYGHRNVQGITWDDDGNLFASEFGQDTWDELNLIEAGGNFGWPIVEGKGSTDAEYVDPLVQWNPEEASPSGITWAQESVWMTGLRGERLWRIGVTEDGLVRGEPQDFLSGEYGRLRTVEAAPDGTLWLITSNTDGRADPREGDDRILRLELR